MTDDSETIEAIPPRRQRWPAVLAVGLLLSGLVVAAGATLTLPYYASSPGQVIDVADFVTVDGTDTYFASGDLFFLTVSSREVTAFEYVEAFFDGEVDLRPREQVRPSGQTTEQRRRRGLDQQEEAKRRAIFVALSRLGFDAVLSGEGALVVQVIEGAPAEGMLDVTDVIVGVNGRPVGLVGDLIDAIAATAPGDSASLAVERLAEDDSIELIEVKLTLAEHPDEDGRGFIGVGLETFNVTSEFEVEVGIDSQNIGGPSSGMMYTLGIMNLLTEDDLTKGHRVAGTGTIQVDGTVGPIGGVRQKVYAARTVGAEYVLVPNQNYEDALEATGDEVEIVAVGTLDDALEFLAGLP